MIELGIHWFELPYFFYGNKTVLSLLAKSAINVKWCLREVSNFRTIELAFFHYFSYFLSYFFLHPLTHPRLHSQQHEPFEATMVLSRAIQLTNGTIIIALLLFIQPVSWKWDTEQSTRRRSSDTIKTYSYILYSCMHSSTRMHFLPCDCTRRCSRHVI